MSYNDVLNYTIGILEFLYKNDFDDIAYLATYTGSGEIIKENMIIMTDSEVASKISKDRSLWSQLTSKPNHDYRTLLIFACNEPNFNYGDNFTFTDCGLHCLSNLEISKKGKLKQSRIKIMTSDYNHHTLEQFTKTKYYRVDVCFFFFQGYLAYQWYRQYKMYKPFDTFTHKFNSMSRIIDKKRAYRLYLTSQIIDLQGHISCSAVCPDTGSTVSDILNDDHCFLTSEQKDSVKSVISRLPLRYDRHEETTIPNQSYDIDWYMLGSSFLHIVNETVFYDDFVHLTEKIFKPIVCQRPFVLTSSTGALEFLKRYGFKTFDKWWDESYDEESDHKKRIDKIVDIVKYINSLSLEELHKMYEDMLPVLEHNRNLFFNEFEDKVLQELVENYIHQS